MIDNPAYKGEWAPRKIANPNFFIREPSPFQAIHTLISSHTIDTLHPLFVRLLSFPST